MKKLVIIGLVMIFSLGILQTNLLGANTGEWTTLKRGYVLAVSERLFDKAMDFIQAQDRGALRKLLESGLVTMTQEGTEVYVEDIHMWRGVAEVRLRGKTRTLWTNVEAIGVGN